MSKFTKFCIGVVAFLIIGLLIAVQFVVRIPDGFVGVVYSPSGGAKDNTLGPGWHAIGFFEKVTEYPVRLQTVEYSDVQTATSDGKNITIQNVSFNYQIQPDKVVSVFRTFGPIDVEEIEESYLRTRLLDAARKGVSKYTIIDIYGEKSSDAAGNIQTIFTENIGKLGFNVSDLTLGVPSPDPKTQEAIDARVKASQELERKQTELEIAKKEAERKIAEAKGIADAQVEEAKGTSDANKLLEQSITPELLEMKRIEVQLELAKNQNLPRVIGSGSILNIPQEVFNSTPKK